MGTSIGFGACFESLCPTSGRVCRTSWTSATRGRETSGGPNRGGHPQGAPVGVLRATRQGFSARAIGGDHESSVRPCLPGHKSLCAIRSSDVGHGLRCASSPAHEKSFVPIQRYASELRVAPMSPRGPPLSLRSCPRWPAIELWYGRSAQASGRFRDGGSHAPWVWLVARCLPLVKVIVLRGEQVLGARLDLRWSGHLLPRALCVNEAIAGPMTGMSPSYGRSKCDHERKRWLPRPSWRWGRQP